MPLIALGVIGAVGSIGGAAIASHGANKAANTQAQAADYAAQLQKQQADAALAEQKRQFDIGQSNLAPWLSVGRSGLANLAYLSGLPMDGGSTNGVTPGSGWQGSPDYSAAPEQATFDTADRFNGTQPFQMPSGSWAMPPASDTGGATPGASYPNISALVNKGLGAPGSLNAPFTEKFSAPTVTDDPGYQFRLKQGLDAIQRTEAANGTPLTGGAAKDLNDYAQGSASQEYGNAYNRAFNQYATRFNIYNQNQANTFNRLAAISGVGQQTAGQLSTLGQADANNTANINLTSGAQIGQNINNAGAARASGYAAGANAYGGAFGNIGNNLTSLYLLSKMFPGGQQPADTGQMI